MLSELNEQIKGKNIEIQTKADENQQWAKSNQGTA